MGFALDYQIAICFEIGDITLIKGEVIKMVDSRFEEMKIMYGTILKFPVAVMCQHASDEWNGIVKVHLKYPDLDGIPLLTAVRPFILKVDEKTTLRGKICKSFDNIAPPRLLNTKINNSSLVGKTSFEIQYELVDEGVKRGVEFEITSVTKRDDHDYAWISTTLPEEAEKLRKEKIYMDSEVFVPKFAPEG